MMSDDMALLQDYARNNSSEAFSELVNRYIHLVYSVALRRVRDPHLAEEITQVVFIILARKARSLSSKTILPGWLCRTAQFASANALTTQYRRQRREQEAQQEASMQTTENESLSETWTEIAPLLDDAMNTLGEKEYNAIVLRFFDGKDFKQVGTALGTGEDAARMRVNRGLEKLRKFLSKRGIASTTAIIAGAISTNAVHAAPPALSHSVASIAIVKGTAAAASTVTLVGGTLKAIYWSKFKFACGITAAILLAGTIATVAITTAPHLIQDDQDDHNDRYQIEGSLMYDARDSAFTCDFAVTVNGPNWAIRRTNFKQTIKRSIDWAALGLKTPPPSGSPPRPESYAEEVCLNGTVYQYLYFGKPPADDPAKNNGGAMIIKNTGGAMIDYGDSAVEDGTFADFAWVGLASGYYFSHATNDQVTSLFGISANARTWYVHAEWQLNDEPPYLPKSIDYYQGPTHMTKTGNSPFPTMIRSDKLFIGGKVRVLQSTTINGRTFPTAYTYEQFRPTAGFSSTNVQHQLWVTVNVKKIILHDVPDVLPPKTDGITPIEDFRGSHFQYPMGGNEYIITSGRLPEKPDLEAIKKFRQQVREFSRTNRPARQPNHVP
jgi:RNA polymerase sigma factor (sigma-70 family)